MQEIGFAKDSLQERLPIAHSWSHLKPALYLLKAKCLLGNKEDNLL